MESILSVEREILLQKKKKNGEEIIDQEQTVDLLLLGVSNVYLIPSTSCPGSQRMLLLSPLSDHSSKPHYLFIFGCAGSSLLRGLSLVVASGS